MKVTVNKCPDTGKLFENDRDYRNHRAQFLRAQRREQQRIQQLADRSAELSRIRALLTDPADLAEWFMTNQDQLIRLYNLNENHWPSSKIYETDKFFDIHFTVKYCNHIPNTHDCPDGGVTNFGWGDRHTNGKPTGYPGWNGRISGKLHRLPKHMSSYPASDLLQFCKIKTGTGGGGNESWGYSMHIFLDDWPSLLPFWQDLQNQLMVEKIINSGPRLSLNSATC